ncbi:MAG TPA: PAS domain S-box protein [Nevskiaceae bacterium]|nr:PAS domain S-box protein [Nevskiaceae bacterium]
MIDAVDEYAIFLLDVDGHVRTWNPGARRLKGYEADEIIGRHFSVFYPQARIDARWPEHELEVAGRAGRFEDEGWRLRKDGSRFWANVVITRLLGPDGRIRGFCKITRDLTERRWQEEAVRQSEERFRLMVESVQDYAIFLLDPQGRVMTWNIGAQKTKGYRTDEILGQHFSVFYPDDVVASGWPARELEIALRDGRVEDEGWRLRKDGSRFWASVVITALHDQDGNHFGFAKVTRDLTDRRRIGMLEDEGRRITTFLAMLGHELRNPLAPISNALSIMQVAEIESPEVRKARDVIARQLGQLTRLVDDLLDLGRITSGKVHLEVRPVRLRDVLSDAIEAVNAQIEDKGQVLRVTVEDEDLWVAGDRVRLVQIVLNLLTNATKFTQGEGSIEVTLARRGDRAEIGVRDNGPGIPPAMLQDVFNLFVQGAQDAARSHGGLGLGLSLVQQLATLHGGDVSAFSSGQPGKGAEFVVRLPVIRAQHDEASPPNPAPAIVAKRILVVDDNVDSAESLGMLLDMLGYATRVLHDGRSAFESILKDPPHVALLDLGLPGMDGLEIARRLHAQMQRPPLLVALTGYGQQKDREESRRAGFRAHLTKPLQLDELQRILDGAFSEVAAN